jgi:hypothetical protein
MKQHLRKWFSVVWGDQVLRLRVAGQYSSLKASPQMLADIAARNFVFAQLPDDPHAMAVAEGRRRCALELLELARVDVDEIANVRFALPSNKRESGDAD